MESGVSGPAASAHGRIWTVEEANARLESLREILPTLRAWVVRLRAVHGELERLAGFWGKELESADHPDRDLKMRLDEEWRSLTRRLEGEVARLHGEGIEVKDLDTGLVDFVGRLGREVVYLCWQRGEEHVGFYHALDGGFRNRRPIASGARPAAQRPSGGADPA
ncbi:MAG TPA: DUF2203 domain-containing protein [Thermoplasmata archaeon]|nr:DUF2203 domain-containing protein [Thermoplasmata archaeon]HUJ77614.1 DUF2203 domain-containing protein [Thermoplasmata archaeon]